MEHKIGIDKYLAKESLIDFKGTFTEYCENDRDISLTPSVQWTVANWLCLDRYFTTQLEPMDATVGGVASLGEEEAGSPPSH